jgi:hypothetical protein
MIRWSAYPNIFGYTQPWFGPPQTSIGMGLVIPTEQLGQKLAQFFSQLRSGSETHTHKRLDAIKIMLQSKLTVL